MSHYPTADQFYVLANTQEYFEEVFHEKWARDLEGATTCGFDLSRKDLISLAVKARDKGLEYAMCENALYAYQWLKAEPSFVLATQAVGLTPTIETLAAKCTTTFGEKREVVEGLATSSFLRTIERRIIGTQRYISGVAKCSANYLSGRSVKFAVDRPAAVASMQRLTDELRQVISATEALDESSKGSILHHLKFISEHLDRLDTPAISRRRDVKLAARLMASELIKLHFETWGTPCNRAVFQLMGLPFIEEEIEMRTIERLALTSKEHIQIEKNRENARLMQKVKYEKL